MNETSRLNGRDDDNTFKTADHYIKSMNDTSGLKPW